MSDTPDESPEKLNTIGPAGETADPNVGVIVSGQPAGGSDALDSKVDNGIAPAPEDDPTAS